MNNKKVKELIEKLREAGDRGLSANEMGDLFHAPEDHLSDIGMIKWTWEHRGPLWMKICRLVSK